MIPLRALRESFVSFPSGVEEAICIAASAHCYQRNKFNSEPYIVHVLRVVTRLQAQMTECKFNNDDFLIVACLHDTVEDSGITLQNLRECGFLEHIVEAVDAISRRADETYTNFIRRAKENPLARVVKIADLQDHLSGPEPVPGMHKKYGLHLTFLLAD